MSTINANVLIQHRESCILILAQQFQIPFFIKAKELWTNRVMNSVHVWAIFTLVVPKINTSVL